MNSKNIFRKAAKLVLMLVLIAAPVFCFQAYSVHAATTADGFEYTVSGSNATITKYTGTGGNVTIPDIIDGYTVTSIGEYVFYNCGSLKSVTIPASVTSIGGGAFYNCSRLTSVTIPASVTSIGDAVFGNCSSLTNVSIPAGVTSIGDKAFQNCSALTSVTIPDGVTSIGEDAFNNCSSLTSMAIPDSVTSIGDRAFSDNSSLTNVSIPASVTSIGNFAFVNCTRLSAINVSDNNTKYSSVDGVLYNKSKTYLICVPSGKIGAFIIPASVTSFDNGAFSGNSLTSVTIPDSMTSIGDSAFSDNSSLTNVSISASVTSIGNFAFLNCSRLSAINVSDNNTKYSSVDGVLYNKSKTSLICVPSGKIGALIIPASVTSIENGAFTGSSLTSVTIPESMTSIGKLTFYNCSRLTSVTIPASVTSIGNGAFFNCSSLKTIIAYPTTAPFIGPYPFDLVPSTAVLYIPSGAKGYNVAPWTQFQQKVLYGWVLSNNTWYYYQNGTTVKNGWAKDSTGWCFLNAVDGSWVQKGWALDSRGWRYIQNGYWVEHSIWAKDSKGWCYIGDDGYLVNEGWALDSQGWCHIVNGYWDGQPQLANKPI